MAQSAFSNTVRAVVWTGFIALAGGIGCGSTTSTVQRGPALHANARWALLPVANHSETPQAGERVEAVLETLLRRAGVQVLEMYPPPKQDENHVLVDDRQRYEEALVWARSQPFHYAVSGSVEEWRYKNGIDGEPAVGVTVKVSEVPTGRVLWSASGTRTGSGSDNASGTALLLLQTLTRELDVSPR